MTTRLESELTEAMRDHAGSVSLGTDVLAAATRRHRRRTAIHRGAYALGVIGLAGAVTAAIAIGRPASTPAADPKPGPAVVAEGPTVRLAAAAAATTRTTFRLAITFTRTGSPHGRNFEITDKYAGAYDPVHNRGYLTFAKAPGMEIRIIGDDYYVRRNGWIKLSAAQVAELFGMARGLTGVDVDEATTHPEKLIEKLRSLGTVTHTGRSGGVDTYRYSYRTPASRDYPAHPVTGEVHVDAATNHIVKITQNLTVTGANPEIADKDPITFRTEVNFSDFGIPVTVERPTT